MKQFKIAFWDGIVFGSGVGISINCNVRIATSKSQFAMPESSVGIFNDAGMTQIFPRITNNEICFGLYAGLTGARIKGCDLIKWGIATHFVEDENLASLKEAIISRVDMKTTDEEIYKLVAEFATLGKEYPLIDRQALAEKIENADYIR